GAELRERTLDVRRRTREDAAGEGVVRVVRERERLLEVLRAHDGHERAEDLLGRDPGAGIPRHDDGRAGVPSAGRHVAAPLQPPAFLAPARLIAAYAVPRLFIDERADDRAERAGVADPHDRGGADQTVHQRVETWATPMTRAAAEHFCPA